MLDVFCCIYTHPKGQSLNIVSDIKAVRARKKLGTAGLEHHMWVKKKEMHSLCTLTGRRRDLKDIYQPCFLLQDTFSYLCSQTGI